jgi:DNA uptake protein ComE-like DNA-binding protein
MRYLPVLSALSLAAALGCTPSQTNPTPDQIRKNTADATATAARDIKAAAEGVRDGLHKDAPAAHDMVNINTADRPTLETLPGVDPVVANLIVRHRPYNDPSDLLKKHVLTHAQYDPISARLTTSN